jgi:alkane 1-monooxygenase
MFARYLGPVAFLLLIPALAYTLGPIAAIGSALLVPVVLVGAEFAFPGVRYDPDEPVSRRYRLLPLLYVPLQLAVTGWATWLASQPFVDALDFLSLCISTGIMAGLFGVLAAHELIHSHARAERMWGTLMLLAMSYPHFRTAHIYGHHRHAASRRDPTTARLGESFYAFVPRSLFAQFLIVLRHARNWLLLDIAATVAIYSVIARTFGLWGVIFFALQSVVAIIALALFDYVAHYGLMRRPGEPLSDRHSWNASHAVCNAVLFNMGRHSDHHRRAVGPYQTLHRQPEGPELPAGYAGSMLLALIPPLWRRAMDARARLAMSGSAD